MWKVADVAAFLGVAKSWVYDHAAAGTLPCTRILGLLRFDPAKIKAIACGAMSAEAAGGRIVSLPLPKSRRKNG